MRYAYVHIKKFPSHPCGQSLSFKLRSSTRSWMLFLGFGEATPSLGGVTEPSAPSALLCVTAGNAYVFMKWTQMQTQDR